MMTKAEKKSVRTYRMWAVMEAEDAMRMSRELAAVEAGMPNMHVHAFHARNHRVCQLARQDRETGLKLYN